MSNLFYRGGGVVRADSNLSILKEAKKNYMGQFIFSRGMGVYLLIPMPKKKYTILWWLHLILWQLLYRLNKYDFSNNMS